jgi:hypothetical protein
MMLRRIFGAKREKVTGGWRNLDNEELHNLYSSCNLIRLIKLRGLKWMEHVAKHVRCEKCLQSFGWKA